MKALSFFGRKKAAPLVEANKPNKVILVEIAAEKYGVSYDEMVEVMRKCRDEYGITYFMFVKNDLYHNMTEEKLTAVQRQHNRKKQGILEKISTITGWSLEETIAETERIRSTFGIPPKQYYGLRLFLLSDEELAQSIAEKDKQKKERIKHIREKTGWSRHDVVKHMTNCSLKYSIDADHYMIFKCWELDDQLLATYSTMSTSRTLCGKYNKGHVYMLEDKNKFNQIYRDYIGRKFWWNQNTSFEEFSTFAQGLTEIFIKPLDSCSGRGTEIISVPFEIEAKKKLYAELINRPSILVEECVKQHPLMAEIYPNSVNTVRIVTLMKDGVCNTLCAFVRFGCEGITDNFGNGGVLAAVDVETGKIITPAINMKGQTFAHHPVTEKEILGFQIPHWDKVRSITEEAIEAVEGVNYVGWDVAICEDKVVIIEGNSCPGLGAYQSPFSPMHEGKKYIFEKYL